MIRHPKWRVDRIYFATLGFEFFVDWSTQQTKERPGRSREDVSNGT
jgi:hypothetical protein